MRRLAWRAVGMAMAFCVTASVAGPAKQETRFVITGPTVISFFLNYTDKQVSEGDEAFNDFVYYLPMVEYQLRAAGVQVHSVFKVKSFAVKIGARWRTVQPVPGHDVEFCFVAPGRAPRMEFGVEATAGVLGLARQYFGLKP